MLINAKLFTDFEIKVNDRKGKFKISFLQLIEKILIGGIIGVSLNILVNIVFYFRNDYPLFSIVNISLVVGVALLVVIIILYLVVRKKTKPNEENKNIVK